MKLLPWSILFFSFCAWEAATEAKQHSLATQHECVELKPTFARAMQAELPANTQARQTHTHTHTQTHTNTRTHTHTYTHTNKHTHIYTHTHTYRRPNDLQHLLLVGMVDGSIAGVNSHTGSVLWVYNTGAPLVSTYVQDNRANGPC